MNNKIIIIISLIFVVLIIIGTWLFLKDFSNEENLLEEKTKEELKYIGNEIINMINVVNNILFTDSTLKETQESDVKSNNKQISEDSENSDKNQISDKKQREQKYTTEQEGILLVDFSDTDWNYLKNNIEKIYHIWTTTIIDLHSLNVNNEDILNFSNSLDQVTLSIKNEDKVVSLNNLANLYAYIPIYLEQISNDKKLIDINNTKASILNSNAYVEAENWEEVQIQLQSSIDYFTNIINNANEYNEYNKSKITKIYVILNELNNTALLQNKELYYIKYKNVINELINL